MTALGHLFSWAALGQLFYVTALGQLFYVTALGQLYCVTAFGQLFYVTALGQLFYVIAPLDNCFMWLPPLDNCFMWLQQVCQGSRLLSGTGVLWTWHWLLLPWATWHCSCWWVLFFWMIHGYNHFGHHALACWFISSVFFPSIFGGILMTVRFCFVVLLWLFDVLWWYVHTITTHQTVTKARGLWCVLAGLSAVFFVRWVLWVQVLIYQYFTDSLSCYSWRQHSRCVLQHMGVYRYMCVCARMHAWVCICVYMCVYQCVCVCLCVCVCVKER